MSSKSSVIIVTGWIKLSDVLGHTWYHHGCSCFAWHFPRKEDFGTALAFMVNISLLLKKIMIGLAKGQMPKAKFGPKPIKNSHKDTTQPLTLPPPHTHTAHHRHFSRLLDQSCNSANHNKTLRDHSEQVTSVTRDICPVKICLKDNSLVF